MRFVEKKYKFAFKARLNRGVSIFSSKNKKYVRDSICDRRRIGEDERRIKSSEWLSSDQMHRKQLQRQEKKGDLSENAEYDAAKEAQGLLEFRIRKLEGDIGNARVLDASQNRYFKSFRVVESKSAECEDEKRIHLSFSV